MFAIIKTGGKQYKVAVGDKVRVEKLENEVGDQVELDEVLMVAGDSGVKVGQPTVSGAKVVGVVTSQDRGQKIIGFTYKRRKKIRRRWGHRQYYTELEIKDIQG